MKSSDIATPRPAPSGIKPDLNHRRAALPGRVPRLLGAAVVGTTFLARLVAIGIRIAGGAPVGEVMRDIGSLLPFVAFAFVGLIILRRDPLHAVGWLFVTAAALMMATGAATAYAEQAYQHQPPLAFADVAAWLSLWTWVPATTALGLIFLMFPTGGVPSPRWRWVLWLAAAQQSLFLLSVLGTWSARGKHFAGEGNIGDVTGSQLLGFLGNQGTGIVMIACVAGLIVRFRRSTGIERLQLKWVAYAAALMGLLMAVTLMSGFGSEPMDNPLYVAALAVTVTALPVSAGVAILRYRLYEIDFIINKTLVYAILSGVLVLTYLGIVVVLQQILGPVTRESDLAVAGSTLAVAALFRPLRDRVQTFIDKRFYRSRYDAAETLATFSSRLRDRVDLDSLGHDLVSVVGATVQPAYVSLWLRPLEEGAER